MGFATRPQASTASSPKGWVWRISSSTPTSTSCSCRSVVGSLQRSFVGLSSQNDFVGNAAGLYRHLFSKVSYFEQTAGFTPELLDD